MRKSTQFLAGLLCAAAALVVQAQTAPVGAGQGFALEGAVWA
jgi:hypothetical protein